MLPVSIQSVNNTLISTGVSIGFERSAYTADEDIGQVELCLMFRGSLKVNSFLELEIIVIAGSATGVHNT